MYFPRWPVTPSVDSPRCAARRRADPAAAAPLERASHFTDWKAMLDSGEIDAVIVASPNDSHFPITMAALERRLPVLCEKPIAMNADEAIEMAAAARDAQVTTMVPFTYRWMPSNQYVKQLLDDGLRRQPYHLNMRYYAGYARDSDTRGGSTTRRPARGSSATSARTGSIWPAGSSARSPP